MKAGNRTSGVRLRLVLARGVAIGPGKADLLAAIRDAGSIAALNRDFAAPLVEAVKGGAGGGGARLTPEGAAVLDAFRRVETAALRAAAPELERLRERLPAD
jgi:molybdate transport system regulatory protein